MIHSTENGSDLSQNIPPARSASHARRAGFLSLSRTLLHTRAVLRLARRRPSLALGLAVAVGSAVTAATATTSVVRHQM